MAAHAEEERIAKKYKKNDRKRAKRAKKAEGDPRKQRIKAKHLRVLPWWKVMLWAVEMYTLNGVSAFRVADMLGVHRSSIYNWVKRYREGGKEGLKYRSRRPHRIKRMDPELGEKIKEMRKDGMGCERIAFDLQIGHMTVWRYLVREDLMKRKKFKQRKWRFFQRKHSNSMWQVDLTVVDDERKIWALSVLDDHSRFLIRFQIIDRDPTVDDVVEILDRCFRRYGAPREILTDRGTQFYASVGYMSTFDMWLMELWIDHILASRRHPQTNGKVERVIRTVKEECLNKLDIGSMSPMQIQEELDKYREFYNFHRIHIIYEFFECFGQTIRKKVFFIPNWRYAAHH